MRFYLSIIVTLLAIAIGMFMGGTSIHVIMHPAEWILIIGLAAGSFMMSNPKSVFKKLVKQLPRVLNEKPYDKDDYLEMLVFLFKFFKYKNSVSAAEIEQHIEDPTKSSVFSNFPVILENEMNLRFFCDHYRIILLGFSDLAVVDHMMIMDVEKKRSDGDQVSQALAKLGDALPAIGIVAAVLGVIGAMAAAGAAPEVLGARVAGALVGTFAGVLIAYCVVNPIGSFLEKYNNEEIAFLECMKVGLLSYMKGYPSSIAVEFARQVISVNLQPTFYELEGAVYDDTQLKK